MRAERRDRGRQRDGESGGRRHLLQPGVRSTALVTIPSALAHRLMILRLAVPAAAGFFAAAVNLVHRRPRAPLRFALGDAALLVSFFDVFGLTLLFVGV